MGLTCAGLRDVLDPQALPGVRIVAKVTATHSAGPGAALGIVRTLAVRSARLALRLPSQALAVLHEVPRDARALSLGGRSKEIG